MKTLDAGGSKIGSFVSQGLKQLQSLAGGLGGMGTAAAVGGIAVAAGVAIAGKALYDLGSAYDASTDKLVSMTGAHGQELSKLEGVVKTTYGNVTASLMETTTVVGILGQYFHNLNATDMSAVSQQIIELSQLTGGDLTEMTQAAAMMFADAGIKSKDFAGTLDMVKVAADNSGIPVLTLMQNTQQFGTTFRNLGFSMAETLAIMAQAQATGVTVDVVLTGLRKSVASLVDPSTEAQKALAGVLGLKGTKEFLDIKDVSKRFNKVRDILQYLEGAGKHFEALDLASKLFGKKSGQDILDMINKGTFNTDALVKKLEKANGAIGRQHDKTEDAAEKWVKFGHRAQNALQPIASAVFDLVNAISERLLPIMESIMGFIEDHQEILKVLGILIGVVLVAAVLLLVAGLYILFAPMIAMIALVGLVWQYWDTAWNAILAVVQVVWEWLQQTFWAIVTWLQENIPTALWAVAGVFQAAWNWILGAVDWAWQGIQSIFWGLLNWFIGLPGMILGALGDLGGWLWQKGVDLLQGLWEGVKYIWGLLFMWYVGFPLMVLGAIGDLLSTLWQKGADLLQGLFNGVLAVAMGLHGFLMDHIFTPVVNFFADAWHWLLDAGKSVIQGLIDGILSMVDKAKDAVTTVGGAVIEGGKKIFGIGSPSKVFHEIGVNVAEGLRQGIEAGAPGVTDAMANVAGGVVATPITPDMGALPPPVPPTTMLPDTDETQAAADTLTGIQQGWADASIGTAFGTTATALAIQDNFDAQTIQKTADTQAFANAIWAQGMFQMLATTDASLTTLNANTQSHFLTLSMLTQSTMSNVVQTMTTGASTAADYFVAALAARIPPLQFTLASYAESVKAYGRQYLTDIGAPVTFAKGGVAGIDHAQIAADGAFRVWAERGTGGEAYIPRHGANDPYNVLRTAASWYDMSVIPMAEGGILTLAELFWEAASGTDWKNGVDIGRTIGGHADHAHAANANGPWEMLDAYLMSVGIVPGPGSTTGGSHAPGGYHPRGMAKDYGTAANGGVPGVDRIYQAFLALVGGTPFSMIPKPDVPGLPDFGPGIPAEQARIMAFYVRQAMQSKLMEAYDAKMASFAGMGAGGGSGDYGDYARSLFAAHGWGMDQWSPLDMLWTKESHWNPTASNGTYYGIPQGPIGILSAMDAYAQIRWGEDYIASRYGTPASAWAHSQAHNWYDEGGLFGAAKLADRGVNLDPGWNSVFNGTGAMEALRPEDTNQRPIVQNIYPSEGMDEEALADLVVKKQKEARKDERFRAGSTR